MGQSAGNQRKKIVQNIILCLVVGWGFAWFIGGHALLTASFYDSRAVAQIEHSTAIRVNIMPDCKINYTFEVEGKKYTGPNTLVPLTLKDCPTETIEVAYDSSNPGNNIWAPEYNSPFWVGVIAICSILAALLVPWVTKNKPQVNQQDSSHTS